MSEKEHDQTTEEMFEVVNSHASDESRRQAERVAEQLKVAEDTSTKVARKRALAELRAKRICGLILRLLICAGATALFLAALLLSDWVPVLCIAGIAVCLIVGAIATDRCIRSWR